MTSILWIIGRPKAAVFPVPVWASHIRSLFSLISKGIDSCWTGVGEVKPRASIPLSMLGSSGNSENSIWLFFREGKLINQLKVKKS